MHWGYELVESDLLSYYQFNRQESWQKAKNKYNCGGKENAAKYYIENKDVLKENTKKQVL